MNDPKDDQSFSVDDIRRLREQDDIRYRNMSMAEIMKDIHDRAAEGHRIIEELRRKKLDSEGQPADETR